jgi:hypothetical protein
MGRMEDFTEGKVMSMMTLNGTGAIEAAGNTEFQGASCAEYGQVFK